MRKKIKKIVLLLIFLLTTTAIPVQADSNIVNTGDSSLITPLDADNNIIQDNNTAPDDGSASNESTEPNEDTEWDQNIPDTDDDSDKNDNIPDTDDDSDKNDNIPDTDDDSTTKNDSISITLNETSFTLYTGDSTGITLIADVSPKTTDATITWASSNPSVATVNEKGVVLPQSKGTATITATAGNATATCFVTVKAASLTLPSKATVYVNVPYDLASQAQTLPAASIKWKSADKTIATAGNGIVKAKKTGTVKITATANGISKTCTVKVKAPSVSFSETETNIFAGSTVTLSVSATPTENITWKTSNKSVATVDSSGTITAVKKGKAKITAKVGNAKATCTVTVHKNTYKLNCKKRTLTTGTTASLYIKNTDAGTKPTYTTDHSGIVSLNPSGNGCEIKGKAVGKCNVTASFTVSINEKTVYWNQTCCMNVLDACLSPQQFSLAKGKTKSLKLSSIDTANAKISWESSKPSVASVNNNGVVTALETGSAKITAIITAPDGTVSKHSTNMRVSNPSFASNKAVAAVGSTAQLNIKNTNSHSSITWKSSKNSVATVNVNGTVNAYARGTTTIKATVDGKTISCKLYVSAPVLKTKYQAISPGKRINLKLSGLTGNSTVTYKSSNKKIASVNKNGKITASACGKATITIKADGRKLTYPLEIASATAAKATRTGKSIMDASSYSQARRMSTGYYDCSSLVFRSYGCKTSLFGGSASWAPTAAGMAQYMAQTGKVIAWGYVDESQLLPGDIIFYGHSNNGRYLGIYHVSMYYGNGYRLEKPLRSYYRTGNEVMIARPMP